MAIAEYLYERHPKIWPESRKLRARGRSIAGEICSGLSSLRNAMPVNIRGRNRTAEVTPQVERDLDRVREIWTQCLDAFGGPWLLGEFSAADIMYAPVATRFQIYGVAVGGAARDFHDRILGHPLVTEWLTAAATETTVIDRFELPKAKGPHEPHLATD